MRITTTVKVTVHRAAPCILRARWIAEGTVVAERRVYDAHFATRLPEGVYTLELTDTRAVDDPLRLVGTTVEVDTRGHHAVEVSAAIEKGHVVTGTVLGERLVRYPRVLATTADGATLEVRGDGLGGFTLAGLPAGEVHIVASSGRLATRPVAVVAGPGEVDVDLPLEVPTHAPSVLGDPLVVGGAFAGVVLDEATGEPLYAASVEVRDARGFLLARSRTDHQGRFVVGGDLPALAGASVVVKSGPDRIVVDRATRRGLALAAGQLADLGVVRVERSERERRHSVLPRAIAAPMSLPRVRV